MCVCGLQQSKGSETGVGLIKTTIGISFPAKPSGHLFLIAGSVPVGRGVNEEPGPREGQGSGGGRWDNGGFSLRTMAPNIGCRGWALLPGMPSALYQGCVFEDPSVSRSQAFNSIPSWDRGQGG